MFLARLKATALYNNENGEPVGWDNFTIGPGKTALWDAVRLLLAKDGKKRATPLASAKEKEVASQEMEHTAQLKRLSDYADNVVVKTNNFAANLNKLLYCAQDVVSGDTDATEEQYQAKRHEAIHLKDLRRRGIFPTAALASASSATSVKVHVPATATTAAQTKTVTRYPLVMHREKSGCPNKKQLTGTDMVDVYTVVRGDGTIKMKCSCGRTFTGSGMKTNKMEAHMVSKDHLSAVAAAATSTNASASVQAASQKAAARKVEKATTANIVAHTRDAAITMCVQRGQCQTTTATVLDAIAHTVTSVLDGPPIPDSTVLDMMKLPEGLSEAESEVMEKVQSMIATNDSFDPKERATFGAVFAKASKTASKEQCRNAKRGANVLRRTNALGDTVQKNKTSGIAIATSRRTIRKRILMKGADAQKQILAFFKTCFACSGTGDEGQTPLGGEPFLFTMMGTAMGVYDSKTKTFSFGFSWSHNTVLIVDMNQDETGASACKVYTDWHVKYLGKEHLLLKMIGFTFDGASKMRSDHKSALGPAEFDPEKTPEEMLLKKSGVLAGDSFGGRLQRLAVMHQGMTGSVSDGYPSGGFDDADWLPTDEALRGMLAAGTGLAVVRSPVVEKSVCTTTFLLLLCSEIWKNAICCWALKWSGRLVAGILAHISPVSCSFVWPTSISCASSSTKYVQNNGGYGGAKKRIKRKTGKEM